MPITYETILKHMTETGMSIRKTAKFFNITRTMPEKASKQIGNRRKKYSLNIDKIFNLELEDSMYWLGFIAADGCINKKSENNMNLEVGLKYDDITHLEKMQSFFETDYKVKEKTSSLKYKNGEKYKSCRIVIYNTELCKKLIDIGITPRKSLIYKIDKKISTHRNFKHFIRGYLDGDGCFTYCDKDNTCRMLSIVGNPDVVNIFKDYFDEIRLTNNLNYTVAIKNKNKSYEVRVTSKVLIGHIVRDLYSGSNTTYLNRKYDLISGFLN